MTALLEDRRLGRVPDRVDGCREADMPLAQTIAALAVPGCQMLVNR